MWFITFLVCWLLIKLNTNEMDWDNMLLVFSGVRIESLLVTEICAKGKHFSSVQDCLQCQNLSLRYFFFRYKCTQYYSINTHITSVAFYSTLHTVQLVGAPSAAASHNAMQAWSREPVLLFRAQVLHQPTRDHGWVC